MSNATKSANVPAADDRGRHLEPLNNAPGVSTEGRKWLEENAEAIKSMNEWVEKNGLPLAKHRQF